MQHKTVFREIHLGFSDSVENLYPNVEVAQWNSTSCSNPMQLRIYRPSKCLFCNTMEEVDHCFVSCSFAKHICNHFATLLEVPSWYITIVVVSFLKLFAWSTYVAPPIFRFPAAMGCTKQDVV
ncbi:hypothetical protein ACH5RR_008812 [Cinchona calisaya]|uniref:Reverse transcriptase zinc-binding domain-containing protein n=1 Tax=Cinchona calisaya TaxID=153742 RepID=A0ABD3ACE0_9GENT